MEGFSIKKDLEKNFNDYRNLLTNYLKKRYYQDLSDEDIDDIVSNTFVKALKSEDKYVYEGSGGLRSWLVTIAKNSTLNLLLSSKKRDICSQEEEGVMNELNKLYSDQQNEVNEEYDTIIRILDTFNPRDRKIILGYANGYTYEELSKIFEVPLGTIKSKIHHVRKRFKNLNTI